MACFGQASRAAISVPTVAPLTFEEAPAASEWSTTYLPGTTTMYQDPAALSIGVQTLTASNIATTLPVSATVPPSTWSFGFRYNSAGRYLQSRPGGSSAGLVLLATLRNDSGKSATSLTISYSQGRQSPAGGELPGHYAYYSLSGQPGTWVNIAELSGVDEARVLTATIYFFPTPWPAGALLYLLWADDDAASTTDGSYTLDDVEFTVSTLEIPVVLGLLTPTNGQVIHTDAPVGVTTYATGAISSVAFYLGEVLHSTDTSSPYTATLGPGLVPGPYTLWAWATNSEGVGILATNAPVHFIVVPNTGPSIQITSPPNGWSVLVGTAITNQVSVTDDLGVVRVDWFLDGELVCVRSNANMFTYCYNNSIVGTHTIQAVATDAGGLTATSALITVTVTNPLPSLYQVFLPNGSDWHYWASTNGPPTDEAGRAWHEASYEVGSVTGWSNGLAELGGGDNDPRSVIPAYPERTVIPIRGGDPPALFPTIYFRKETLLPANTSEWAVGLLLRLLRDDGALVYLNGIPVWTNNMTVQDWPVPYAHWSGSAAATDDGTVYEELLLPASLFGPLGISPGRPLVVAVEVHQAGSTSTDLSFDLMAWGVRREAPVVILTSPTNQQFFAAGCIPVSIEPRPALTNLIVFVDGQEMAQTFTPPFNLKVAVGPGTHQLRVRVSDWFGAVGESEPVSITVAAPNAPPTVAITNTFSTAGSRLTFLVGTAIGNRLLVADFDGVVTQVDWYVNGQLRLRTPTNFLHTEFWENDALTGTHVFEAVAWDDCGASARSAPVVVTVTNPPPPTVILVPNGSVWKYFNTNQAPPDQGLRTWIDPDYDDSTWPSGPGELGWGDSLDPARNPQMPERTVLNGGPATNRFLAAYFRHAFHLDAPALLSNLTVHLLRDDGGVVYLNGRQVFSDNMPSPPYSYSTLASASALDDGTEYRSGTGPVNLLVPGRNVLAVEVHQASASSSDLSFDLMLWGLGRLAPRLRIAWVAGGGTPAEPPILEVRWTEPGAVLIQSEDLTLPLAQWSVVPTTGTTYRPPPGTRMFYALRMLP